MTETQTQETVTKDWAREPIPVREHWRTCYAASSPGYWRCGTETLAEAVRYVQRDGFEVTAVGRYETRVASGDDRHGIYFQNFAPQLDEADHDITRNLTVLA